MIILVRYVDSLQTILKPHLCALESRVTSGDEPCQSLVTILASQDDWRQVLRMLKLSDRHSRWPCWLVESWLKAMSGYCNDIGTLIYGRRGVQSAGGTGKSQHGDGDRGKSISCVRMRRVSTARRGLPYKIGAVQRVVALQAVRLRLVWYIWVITWQMNYVWVQGNGSRVRD